MSDDLASLERHHSEMERGSAWLLNAIRLARRGVPPENATIKAIGRGKLLWRDESSAATWQRDETSCRSEMARRVHALALQRDALAEAQRTHRDPCFFCGTRADYGCGCEGAS